jgi:putrescine importer
VLLIGAICLAGALAFSYQLGAELLNFGALLAFMGVNVASAVLGWRQGRASQWVPILLAFLGFVICGFIWFNLSRPALIAGGVWALVGVIFWLLYGRRSRVSA